jgi:hypothetical protein
MHRLLFLLLPLLALVTVPLTSQAIEEPDFEVLRRIDNVELRRYAPYAVAEVVLAVDPVEAGGQAFPILAGYIFGNNKGDRKLAITAPVMQATVPVKMDMTAPVTQTPLTGGIRVQFVLPKRVTVATAPEPLDPRVQLRKVPASDWAVLRFSGTWSQANYDEHLALLRSALATAAIATRDEPVLARYNAPFTPWFMRRNEIWLALP